MLCAVKSGQLTDTCGLIPCVWVLYAVKSGKLTDSCGFDSLLTFTRLLGASLFWVGFPQPSQLFSVTTGRAMVKAIRSCVIRGQFDSYVLLSSGR